MSAAERASKASTTVGANEQASGPVRTSGFMVVPDHSAHTCRKLSPILIAGVWQRHWTVQKQVISPSRSTLATLMKWMTKMRWNETEWEQWKRENVWTVERKKKEQLETKKSPRKLLMYKGGSGWKISAPSERLHNRIESNVLKKRSGTETRQKGTKPRLAESNKKQVQRACIRCDYYIVTHCSIVCDVFWWLITR